MAVSHWFFSLNHLFNWFVRTADSFWNEASDCIYEWVIVNHWLTRFVQKCSLNETPLCLLLEMRSGSAVTLFVTIFVDDRVKSCSTCLLICCIKPISHLQTPLIIIKSCHSPYRDLWAHRKWELESELSRHKSTCKCDTFLRNLREWVYLLLITAIKFCSVFSANNPTVNDVSGVTMLSVAGRGGDDFWCASVVPIFDPMPNYPSRWNRYMIA